MVTKKPVLIWIVLLLIAVALPGIVGCGDSDTEVSTIEIPGTGACQGLLTDLATAFNTANFPNYQVTVPDSTGSTGGIEAVGKDQAVLGRVGRPPKDTEPEAGYGLEYLVFAQDKVVFAVSADVDVANLTTEQVKSIFSGNITNWAQVGGTASPINVFTREKTDSSRAVIEKHISGFAALTLKSTEVNSDPDMLVSLETFDGAIGWCTRSALVDSVAKTIALDGVEPTNENVSSGLYDLVLDYGFVYKEARLNKVAEAFIDFVFSADGAAILEEDGTVPASDSR